MKLYYLPGACSLATYISLLEAGQKFEAVAVERGTKKTADGTTLDAINPKGYVPTLVLDDGSVLTENAAVLAYVSSLNPAARLAPPCGSLGFFRVLEWIAYINTELHKTISVVFRPDTPEEMKAIARNNVRKRLDLVENALTKAPFLTGPDFTVADAYLWVVLSWSPRTGVDLAALPRIRDFVDRVRARPSVAEALKGEGL
jgi:glutathione S-transferase